jgi:hypothetical protein
VLTASSAKLRLRGLAISIIGISGEYRHLDESQSSETDPSFFHTRAMVNMAGLQGGYQRQPRNELRPDLSCAGFDTVTTSPAYAAFAR